MGFNPFKAVGKAVKGITKPFKKILRSPIGKVAGLAALYYGAPMLGGYGAGGAGWKKMLTAKAPWLYKEGASQITGPFHYEPSSGILANLGRKWGSMGTLGKAATVGAAAMGAGAMGDDVLEEKKTVIDTSGHEGYLNSRKMFVDEWTEWLVDQGHDEDTARAMAEKELFSANEGGLARLAQGGRIGMKDGPNPHGGFDSMGGNGDTSHDKGGERHRQKAMTDVAIGLERSRGSTPQEEGFRRYSINPYTSRPTSQAIQHDPGGQGGQPTWQRLGYPSYAAWLAAQQSQGGGGGTGTGGAGDYYGFKEWEDWTGGPTTPLFGGTSQYQGLLSKGGRIGLYAGGMGGMNNSMNPMMNQGLGATGAQGMNPYNQQNLMAQGQMRGQPGGMPGGRPPMPGGPTTDQGPGITSARLPKQNEDNELLKLIRMLASMGIPMEQLRGRTKEELVEMVMSLSAKAEAQGGGEEVIEEQEEVVEASHGGRIHAAGGLGEMYPPQGSYPNSDLEFQTEEQASSSNPGNAEMYLEEDEEEEYVDTGDTTTGIFRDPEFEVDRLAYKRAGGGLMRTRYTMGSEQPVIPSKDGPQIDYRGIGGYQPHGRQEKKDDVRALLAQGEFVVTSDAVKGIGDGDRDLGAKRMYDMMHKYEPIGRALS